MLSFQDQTDRPVDLYAIETQSQAGGFEVVRPSVDGKAVEKVVVCSRHWIPVRQKSTRGGDLNQSSPRVTMVVEGRLDGMTTAVARTHGVGRLVLLLPILGYISLFILGYLIITGKLSHISQAGGLFLFLGIFLVLPCLLIIRHTLKCAAEIRKLKAIFEEARDRPSEPVRPRQSPPPPQETAIQTPPGLNERLKEAKLAIRAHGEQAGLRSYLIVDDISDAQPVGGLATLRFRASRNWTSDMAVEMELLFQGDYLQDAIIRTYGRWRYLQRRLTSAILLTAFIILVLRGGPVGLASWAVLGLLAMLPTGLIIRCIQYLRYCRNVRTRMESVRDKLASR